MVKWMLMMTGFTVKASLAKGEQIFAAWVASSIARNAEAAVKVGFDMAFFDLQHGEGGFAEARDSIAAVRRAGKPSGVRVGLEGYGEAARLLDVGAEVAVLPMVNSVDDARRLVDTLKYPPLGGRSWGPTRAIDMLGLTVESYRAGANDNVVVLAMIETRAAVAAVEDILDVPGLDGVFVGPSDLSISLSDGARLDHRMPEAVAVMERLVEAARKRGKTTAIFCAGGEAARRNAAMGFDILAVGGDMAFLTDGAKAALTAARGSAGEGGARY
jgi:4-hydroxy-2-oxoheptanedioate aldolase